MTVGKHTDLSRGGLRRLSIAIFPPGGALGKQSTGERLVGAVVMAPDLVIP